MKKIGIALLIIAFIGSFIPVVETLVTTFKTGEVDSLKILGINKFYWYGACAVCMMIAWAIGSHCQRLNERGESC
jgi:hypothetical protein